MPVDHNKEHESQSVTHLTVLDLDTYMTKEGK